MRREKAIANITPTYKYSFTKSITKSPARTPTAKSPAIKSRNPSLPKNATARAPTSSSQKAPNPVSNIAMPYTDAYASSKEKLLISKIITLKKEKNDLCLGFQKREELFHKSLEKVKSENESLKSVLKQIIPVIRSSLDQKIRAQVQELLERDGKVPTLENGTQCNMLSPETESGSTNKVSTGPQSLNPYEENAVLKEGLEEFKDGQNEKECLKTFVGFVVGKKGIPKKAPPKSDQEPKQPEVHTILPTFLKSLYISQ